MAVKHEAFVRQPHRRWLSWSYARSVPLAQKYESPSIYAVHLPRAVSLDGSPFNTTIKSLKGQHITFIRLHGKWEQLLPLKRMYATSDGDLAGDIPAGRH